MKVVVFAYLFLNLIVLPVNADIIYFKDGMKTICQEKAWEEDDQIKCEYAGWVLTYPKADVLRVLKTRTKKQNTPTEKNDQKRPIITKDSGKKKDSPPIADGIVFYNPRRRYTYWAGKNSKHNSYKKAIQALANRYGRSPEWVQAQMGDTNDLEQIHQNLANQVLNRETVVEPPPAPTSSGIVFYNPRRPFPYWTGKALKHKSYKEAIQALAVEYGQSPQWIQKNMGESNDLNEIHQNLKNAN
jgi:hypothetical protein